jgi:hypothetical protein
MTFGTCVTVILRVNAPVASLLQKRGRHHIALAGSTSMFWVTAGTHYYCLAVVSYKWRLSKRR